MKIWLADLTYDQQFVAADTMPLSIATLAAYVKHHSRSPLEIRLFKYPGTLIDAIETEPLPDLFGFSNFIWNSRLSLLLTDRIREVAPAMPIVYGGLHYPNEVDTQEEWLRRYPEVDFYVYKEGENGLLALIERLIAEDLDVAAVKRGDVPGVHYLRADGACHIVPPAERVKDLAAFPSPYLTGLLDEFFDGKLMPLITTNRGCPFTCTFCSEGAGYYGAVNKSQVERVASEFDYIGRKITELGDAFPQRAIYITDSNFGMYKEDLQVCEAIRETKRKYDWPEYIHTTTGKNHKERVLAVAKLLEGGMRLSGSVQSLDPEVQKNMRRQNIRADELMKVALEAGQLGANTYSEVILALPGDSLDAHVRSLQAMVNARYDYVVAHQLCLLPDSEVATRENRDRFRFETRWRPLTKSYGIYDLANGRSLVAAEVEEICVGGINLSYDDYLEARRLNFVLNSFYNDRLLSGFLAVLDAYDIPRWDWIRHLRESLHSDPVLSRALTDFVRETEEELWPTEEELVEFLGRRETVERLLEGELGANLLAKYRIVLVSEHIDPLCEAAKDAVTGLLQERDRLTEAARAFLEELSLFERERKRQAFDRTLEDSVATFHFDMIRFMNAPKLEDVEAFRLAAPRRVLFSRTPEVVSLIERNHRVYGSSRSSIYKQTTRVPVKKLYRQTTYL